MIVLNDNFKVKLDYETYITIGSFDGLHKGHLSLINKTISLSKKNNAKSMVNTFKEHPLNTINKDIAPKIIMDNETKTEILENLGIDILNLCDFNEEMMRISPKDYILNMIRCYNLKGIVTGFNHRFGYKNQGDVELLKKLSKEYKFELHIADPVKINGNIVSSTNIRQYISNGKISEANDMLLRPYFISGTVGHGKKIGRTMNFPTANLVYDKKFVVPGRGVYYTIVEYEDVLYKGITNVGINPTVGGSVLSVETYILNFNKDIYNKNIKVSFIKKIRDEIKFNNTVELKNQLEKDKHFADKQKII